jgi:hypothetical protein
MTDALLLLIVILLAANLWQQRRQHRELIQWIDSLAEMVGEAIDKTRGNDDDDTF